MLDNVYVVGVGMTKLGRHPDKSVSQLAEIAVTNALQDAGCSLSDVKAAFFANTRLGIFEQQHGIRGQVVLRPLGFENIPIFNTDNACASSTAAFNLACAWIKAGMGEVAIAVGSEKMFYPEQRELMRTSFLGGTDRANFEQQFNRTLRSTGVESDKPAQGDGTVFMDLYAAYARKHMKEHGSTRTQLAAVASKNHAHAVENPNAFYRKSMSVEEILNDVEITWPITRSMCAPMTDGGGAVIVCSSDALARFDKKRAIRVLALAMTTGSGKGLDDRSLLPTSMAANRAFELAGIGPKDVSFAEVHDATAFGEIKQIENVGLAELGQGGWLAEHGHSAIGGTQPINPSGGLESKGHPIAATGAIQIHELVTQLRGEAGARQVANARIGLAENGGGFYDGEEATAAVTILAR